MSVDASRGTVTASVVVGVGPAAAFEVFTAEIGDWYVVDRFTVVEAERTVGVQFEPHVGGRLLEVYAATGTGREMGRLTVWQPGRRLGWTDGRGVEVDVRFEASGESGTRVTLEQRGLDRLDPAEAAHVRRFGWHLLLDWFRAHRSVGIQEGEEEDRSMSDEIDTKVSFQGVSPYLYYDDANAALDWLGRVFGFRETARYVDADDVVHESEMQVGDTTIQLCGRTPDPGEGQGVLLIVHVDDVNAQHARVVAAGVEASPPEQQPYGPRTFNVTDPWGYRWYFWQQVHDYVESPGGLRRSGRESAGRPAGAAP